MWYQSNLSDICKMPFGKARTKIKSGEKRSWTTSEQITTIHIGLPGFPLPSMSLRVPRQEQCQEVDTTYIRWPGFCLKNRLLLTNFASNPSPDTHKSRGSTRWKVSGRKLEFLGSHSGIAEDPYLHRCDTVSVGKYFPDISEGRSRIIVTFQLIRSWG